MRWRDVAGCLLLASWGALPGCSPEPSTPYLVKEVVVRSPEDGTSLAGTLTWPTKGCPCPTAVLVPGAGSHDRDYTLFGHKPFAFLADYLARHGIATLRFDERGVGESGGVPGVATPAEMAADVMAWMDFLRLQAAVDPERIGIVGHSEGGTIGTLVAASSKAVAYLILLGAPGLPGVEYNLQYEASMGRAAGRPEEVIRSQQAFQRRVLEVVVNVQERGRAEERLRAIYGELSPPVPEAELERGLTRLLSPHFRFNLTYDPSETLSRVRAPVLAIFGEKDAHVPPEGNRETMLAALDTGSGRDRVVVLPGLNHFMQTAATGSPREYPDIQETMASAAVELILQWIRTHTGPREVASVRDSAGIEIVENFRSVWEPGEAWRIAGLPVSVPGNPINWYVFDVDGRWLGVVEAPRGYRIMDIGPDYVVGRYGADGVPDVVHTLGLIKP